MLVKFRLLMLFCLFRFLSSFPLRRREISDPSRGGEREREREREEGARGLIKVKLFCKYNFPIVKDPMMISRYELYITLL